jgi:DcmR-like sensory protein
MNSILNAASAAAGLWRAQRRAIIAAMVHTPRLVYQQGDHVCTLYSTPEEQLTAAIEYIRGGLARGERCLYVCCEHECSEFRAALNRAGIDVAAEEHRIALVIVTKEQGHLAGGIFDPAKMITMLKGAVEDALAAGFAGLCAAGDMNWVLDGAPGSEKLAEYEALLNHFYRTHRALGLCLYNRKTLPAASLDHCLATHEFVRVAGPILLSNPFYELPEQAMGRTAQPDGVQARIDQISASPAA